MDQSIKAKLAAAGKIAFGGGRVVSAFATATGHGIIGSYMNNHQMTALAARTAKAGLEGGLKMVDEGLDDWKKASE